MRMIITGGSGLIGSALTQEFLRANHEVVVLSRNPGGIAPISSKVKNVAWDGKTSQGWGELVDGAGAIINLAGASIAGEGFFPARWTEESRFKIYKSRMDAAKAVLEAVTVAKDKPLVLVQSSAIGYYGSSGYQAVDEAGNAGDDFMARICQDWERSTVAVETMGIRRVVVRSGIVLSKQGGALRRMLLPFKLFVGGPFGDGKQVMSWIHISDEVEAIRFLIDMSTATGVYNLTAPNPISNAEMGRTIARILRRPYYIPVPAFALRLLFGEVASVVLDGQHVLPKRLLESGFQFKYPRIDIALRDILN